MSLDLRIHKLAKRHKCDVIMKRDILILCDEQVSINILKYCRWDYHIAATPKLKVFILLGNDEPIYPPYYLPSYVIMIKGHMQMILS